ncbi:MAG: tail fiber domain-containing protein, partial [Candidatus Aenigmarchaeota archaeon]|nr:tail fiber domain-containing protein [Candidatus Aenigmarchaeota archaeon]
NETANVGIGTNSPSARLHVSGDAIVSGSISANQLLINGGYPNALTIDSNGNIITKGNLTYSGYTYIIDILRYNGTGEYPYGVKGGYIYPGTCNTGESCMQTNYYLYTSGSTITANTNLAASALFDNGNRVLTSVSAGSGLTSTGSAPSITLALNYNDNLLGWTNLTGYPSACPGGQFVSAIGDTLTCGTPSGSSSGWTMSGSNLFNTTANVGIGTNNPIGKLEVVGTVNATNFYDRDNSQYYIDPSATSIVNNFQVASGVLAGANNEQIEIGTTNDVIRFISGGQERVRIDPDGDLGVGTSTPLAILHISGEGDTDIGKHNFRHEYASNNAGLKPTWYTNRARGTISSKQAVQNGDSLNMFEITGWSGTSYFAAARFGADVDGTVSSTSVPGKIYFATTQQGNSGPTTRMVIDNQGNVGIGTTSPTQKLFVNGNIIANNTLNLIGLGYGLEGGQINLANSLQTSYGESNSWTIDNYNGTLRFFYNSGGSVMTLENNTGNVGIGTTNPMTKLTLRGNFSFGTTSTNVLMQYGVIGSSNSTSGDTLNKWIKIGETTLSANYEDSNIEIEIYPTSGQHGNVRQRLYVGLRNDGSGVLVLRNISLTNFQGSSCPTVKDVKAVHISSSPNVVAVWVQLGCSWLTGHNIALYRYYGTWNINFGRSPQHDQIQDSGTVYGINMHDVNGNWTVSDNVGIGTKSTSARLQINGTNSALIVGNNTNVHLFVNGTTGRVGIGTTNPAQYALYVEGVIYASGSSIKYKKDIEPLKETEKIYNLTPVSFVYKDEYKHFGQTTGSEKQIGLIAEDVAKYAPELVIYIDGEPRNVDYEKLSVLLLSELKKQNEKIKYLEEQVELLNKEMRSNYENSN